MARLGSCRPRSSSSIRRLQTTRDISKRFLETHRSDGTAQVGSVARDGAKIDAGAAEAKARAEALPRGADRLGPPGHPVRNFRLREQAGRTGTSRCQTAVAGTAEAAGHDRGSGGADTEQQYGARNERRRDP